MAASQPLPVAAPQPLPRGCLARDREGREGSSTAIQRCCFPGRKGRERRCREGLARGARGATRRGGRRGYSWGSWKRKIEQISEDIPDFLGRSRQAGGGLWGYFLGVLLGHLVGSTGPSGWPPTLLQDGHQCFSLGPEWASCLKISSLALQAEQGLGKSGAEWILGAGINHS